MVSEWSDIEAALIEGEGELVALAGEIQILTHSYARFSSGGICRADALALETIAPSILDGRPASSFTRYESQTNLSPALESILSTLKDLVLKALGKMIELVGRVLGWIAKQFARGFQRSLRRSVERNIEHVREVLMPAVKTSDEGTVEDVFDDGRYNAIAKTRLHEVLEDNISRVTDPKLVGDVMKSFMTATSDLTRELASDLETMAKPGYDPRSLFFYESMSHPHNSLMEPIWDIYNLADSWSWLYKYSVSKDLQPKPLYERVGTRDHGRINVDMWRNNVPPIGLPEYQALNSLAQELKGATRNNPRLAQGAAKTIIGGQLKAEELRSVLQQVGERSKRYDSSSLMLGVAINQVRESKAIEQSGRRPDMLDKRLMGIAEAAVPFVQNLYRELATALSFHGNIAQCLIDIHAGYKAAT